MQIIPFSNGVIAISNKDINDPLRLQGSLNHEEFFQGFLFCSCDYFPIVSTGALLFSLAESHN